MESPVKEDEINSLIQLSTLERVLGFYHEDRIQKGPLFIAMGGVHGNEWTGIAAMQRVFDKLTQQKPNFKGIFAGVTGNLEALRINKRFIDKDLNRQWYQKQVQKVLTTDKSNLNSSEDIEQKELLTRFRYYKRYFKRHVNDHSFILLDLHTFSTNGSAYAIATKVGKSREWASKLGTPVIIGMEEVIQGTTMHYFNDLEMTSVCFEAGQHNDPHSVNVMEAAIWLTLESVGCLEKNDIEEYIYFKELLELNAKGLPHVVQFEYRHPVNPGDEFVMNPGYSNFQEIVKGEELAKDKNGKIYSPCDGMILMPLYQKQGEDGFFIVSEADK